MVVNELEVVLTIMMLFGILGVVMLYGIVFKE